MSLNELIGRKSVGRPCVPTLNFVVGNRQCNMECKYCISKMTKAELSKRGEVSPLWYRNRRLAFSVAKKFSADTVLITGKGEPTIWKTELLDTIARASDEGFITELQTNGVLLDESYCIHLAGAGLNTIAISRVAVDTPENNWICDAIYFRSSNLHQLISVIQKLEIKMNIRVTFVAMKDYNDSIEKIQKTCLWASQNGVKQVTIRRMGMPNLSSIESLDSAFEIEKFVTDNLVPDEKWKEIINFFMKEYTILRVFDWGSISWSINGVQCLIADCLTVPGLDGTIRYLIYYPDGHLRYSWEHDSTIIF